MLIPAEWIRKDTNLCFLEFYKSSTENNPLSQWEKLFCSSRNSEAVSVKILLLLPVFPAGFRCQPAPAVAVPWCFCPPGPFCADPAGGLLRCHLCPCPHPEPVHDGIPGGGSPGEPPVPVLHAQPLLFHAHF